MTTFKSILPSKIFEVIDRAGISTPKQIIIMSVWDIKKLTNFTNEDITLLKNAAAKYLCAESITCDKLQKTQPGRITTGCSAVDKLLNGGFRKGTITEIYGESGAGKTQIVLQAAAHNRLRGSVFICTEDLFPVKRFNQIKQKLPYYSHDEDDCGNNVFVEHITEAYDLLSCARVRLPKLLDTNKLSLIVIDSVAAPFRSEYTNYIQRAEDMRELAISLIRIAQKYNLAVLCLNQVTASFDGTGDVLPTLGLAWANMVSTRLWLKKTMETVDLRNMPSSSHEKMHCNSQTVHVRELSVVFAAELPNNAVKFIITADGIQSV